MQSVSVVEAEEVGISQPQEIDRTRKRRNVVFDVGMNNGDDSAYYLSRGYRVVAIEANPALVKRARARFRKDVASGRIVIEWVGIIDRPGQVPFWINDERDVFSSFDLERAGRNGMPCHAVDVECVTFDTLLKKHGVPHYLKIDAEGAEQHCLECLHPTDLPEYVSVEAEKLEYLLSLWKLGYRQFKIVDQMRHNSRFPSFSNENVLSRTLARTCWYVDRIKNRFGKVPFARGCSGPFGDQTSGNWESVEQVAYNWLHRYFNYGKRGTLNRFSWYDFHAKKSWQ